MTKTILISDRAFDRISARTKKYPSILFAFDNLLDKVERYEADLEKYRKWADSSKTNLQGPLSGKE